MTRRRRPGDLDEPLFGEDWWLTDQQLFQDSVTRRTGPARGATFATWEAFRSSDPTLRDLEPLDGARAVLDIELNARHAAANTSASREAGHGWEVMKSTERFGFGARSYQDLRFHDWRLQLSCRAVQDVQRHHFEASGMEAGAER